MTENWLSEFGDHFEYHQFEEALNALEHAIEEGQATYSYVASTASIIFKNLGQPDEALEFCRKALKEMPSNPQLLKWKRDLLMELGCYTESLETAYDVLHVDEESERNWYAIGCIHERAGNPEQALEAFNRSLEYGENDRARVGTYRVLVATGRTLDNDTLDWATSSAWEELEDRIHAYECAESMSDYLRELESLLRRFPTWQPFYTIVIKKAMELKDYRRALDTLLEKTCQCKVDLAPDECLILATCQRELGLLPDAVASINRAMDGSPWIISDLVKQFSAEFLARNLSDLLPAVDRALSQAWTNDRYIGNINGSVPDILALKGQLLLAAGMRDEGLDLVAQTFLMAPAQYRTWYERVPIGLSTELKERAHRAGLPRESCKARFFLAYARVLPDDIPKTSRDWKAGIWRVLFMHVFGKQWMHYCRAFALRHQHIFQDNDPYLEWAIQELNAGLDLDPSNHDLSLLRDICEHEMKLELRVGGDRE